MLDNSLISKEGRLALRDIPYQQKIEIFDRKCCHCGYCLLRIIEPLNQASGEIENILTFPTYEDFVGYINEFAFKKSFVIERGCLYNIEDVKDAKNREPYWTVQEIVQNTCKFWNNNEGKDLTEDTAVPTFLMK